MALEAMHRLARRMRRLVAGPSATPGASSEKRAVARGAARVANAEAARAGGLEASRAVLPKDELHAFWRDPDTPNRPEEYVTHDGRSRFLVAFVQPHLG